MNVSEESRELARLNEMFVNISPGLQPEIENSIYYTKLKTLLHPEIFNFCKEKIELKEDLNILRMMVGEPCTESEIREYLDSLMKKYNNGATEDIGLTYHIEITRVDYGVPVFVVIKRNQISVKKFVFRFRKVNQASGVGELSNAGILKESMITGEEKRRNKFIEFMEGRK